MGKKRRPLLMHAQPVHDDGQSTKSGVDSTAVEGAATSAARTQVKPTRAAQPSKRASASIDVLFGQVAKKSAPKKVQARTEEERVEAQQPKRRKGSKTDLFGNGPSLHRRYDEEGLPIYTPEELGIGKGGGTAACPFDCECCT